MFQWEPLLAEIPWANYRLQMELLYGPSSSTKSTGERTEVICGYWVILDWPPPTLSHLSGWQNSRRCKRVKRSACSSRCSCAPLGVEEIQRASLGPADSRLTSFHLIHNIKALCLKASFGTHPEPWLLLCRSVTSLNSPELLMPWFLHFSVTVYLIKFSQGEHEFISIKLFKYNIY